MLRPESSLVERGHAAAPLVPHHAPHCDCNGRNVGGRRQFLRLAGAVGVVGLTTGLFPLRVFGADADLALLLSCIDYRLTSATTHYMARQNLANHYDHLILPGASLGAQTIYPAWATTFWEELGIALDLHPAIRRVFLLDHRDCGAYKAIFKIDYKLNPPLETQVHTEELHKLKASIQAKYSQLGVVMGLMDLKGIVEPIA